MYCKDEYYGSLCKPSRGLSPWIMIVSKVIFWEFKLLKFLVHLLQCQIKFELTNSKTPISFLREGFRGRTDDNNQYLCDDGVR